MKTFPINGWKFPWAFHHGKEAVKRPADAASKRLNGQFKTVGIHKEIESTFHSSRHTAKDIMRVAKIDQRTYDLQTGHTLKTVSDNHGAKKLKREELEVFNGFASSGRFRPFSLHALIRAVGTCVMRRPLRAWKSHRSSGWNPTAACWTLFANGERSRRNSKHLNSTAAGQGK